MKAFGAELVLTSQEGSMELARDTALEMQKKGKGGEIHITDAIRNLIFKGSIFFGNIFKGKYLDCGTIDGYIKSSIQIFKGN